MGLHAYSTFHYLLSLLNSLLMVYPVISGIGEG